MKAISGQFLRQFRYPLLFRGHGHRVSVYPSCFPPTVHKTASPSLHGVPRDGSPASSVLRDAPTPCRPSRRTSFPSLGDTIVSSHRSSPPASDVGPRINLELVSRVSRAGISMETAGSPKFLGNPRVHSPCSPTPAGPGTAEWDQVSACLTRPPRCPRRRLPRWKFRGSITRPLPSLSTLRSGGHPPPRKTRFRLLAQLCRAGLVTRRVPTKGFTSSRLILLSRASLARGSFRRREDSSNPLNTKVLQRTRWLCFAEFLSLSVPFHALPDLATQGTVARRQGPSGSSGGRGFRRAVLYPAIPQSTAPSGQSSPHLPPRHPVGSFQAAISAPGPSKPSSCGEHGGFVSQNSFRLLIPSVS